MAKKSKTATRQPKRHIELIVSDEKKPAIKLAPGMKFEVVGVTLRGAKTGKAQKVAARLCGDTSTCITLMEV
jgi:hypothetical protein